MKKRYDNELNKKEKKEIAGHLKKGLESRLGSIGTRRIIDIGGGDGDIAYQLASLFSEVVVIEQDEPKVNKLREIGKDTPQFHIWQGDFMQYEADRKFDAALLGYVLFLMPVYDRDKLLQKSIDTVVPGGWVVPVLNSITSREGNNVHFREYMETRGNTIRGTKHTVEQRLKDWGYSVEVERVEIKHTKKSIEEMADLVSLVLCRRDRRNRQKILEYVEQYLGKPSGYEFYVDHEVLWANKPTL